MTELFLRQGNTGFKLILTQVIYRVGCRQRQYSRNNSIGIFSTVMIPVIIFRFISWARCRIWSNRASCVITLRSFLLIHPNL